MAQAWETWWASTVESNHRSLPLLVIWGCWLVRNNLIFEEKACTPEIIGAMAVGIIFPFPQHIRAAKQREVLELEIDREIPWGFFDGAAQNNVSGGGSLLFLSVTHLFEQSVGLGEGSNKFAELLSLKLRLIFAAEKGCRNINIYGDSMNVINWKRGIHQCKNLRVSNLLTSIREILQVLTLSHADMSTGKTKIKQIKHQRRGCKWPWGLGR